MKWIDILFLQGSDEQEILGFEHKPTTATAAIDTASFDALDEKVRLT